MSRKTVYKFGILKRIPSEFGAFGYTIPIEYDSEETDKQEVGEEEVCEAFYSPSEHKIVIDSRIEDEKHRIELFSHEWMEMANELLNLKLEHPKIQALGNLMAQLLITGK
jgi:hypothetical protein